MSDHSQALQQQVLSAFVENRALQIQGGQSKRFFCHADEQAEVLSTQAHHGIIDYQPSELVLTARSGTPLKYIETVLAENGQMLAFEPPYFAESATLGGCIAVGLSGSRRAYAGSVRDTVLGVRLINGYGQVLKFGGQVMKNVAGFDVSRLQVGAFGTLGVLLDVSLKVLPRPETEMTLCFAIPRAQALSMMTEYGRKNLPLSALSWVDDRLYVRLTGSANSLHSWHTRCGGELMAEATAQAFWHSLREQQHAFFQTDVPLWRFSLAPAQPVPEMDNTCLFDWGGALRWFKTDQPAEQLFALAQSVNAYALRFRAQDGALMPAVTSDIAQLQQKIKYAFDPKALFNRQQVT